MADFGVTEDGHPDEVVLPARQGMSSNERFQTGSLDAASETSKKATNHASVPARAMQPPPAPKQTPRPTSSNQPRPQPQTPNQSMNRPGSGPQHGRPQPQLPVGKPPQGRPGPAQGSTLPQNSLYAAQHAAPNNMNAMTPTMNEPPSSLGGFFSAKSAEMLLNDIANDGKTMPPNGAKVFDPHADSPSIRKTPGIDHRSSKPVGRNGQHVAPKKHEEEEQQNAGAGSAITPSQARAPLGNVVNPSLNQARQIGAPGSGSPMGNRGQFRPLSVKRPAPTGIDGGSRAPLTELSTNGAASTENNSEVDVKRLKTA
jgi:DNA repair and recombination protein RAD52